MSCRRRVKSSRSGYLSSSRLCVTLSFIATFATLVFSAGRAAAEPDGDRQPVDYNYRTTEQSSLPSPPTDAVSVPEKKRSMSWLLAAVMSVCEEDPRKCRVPARERVRLPDGEKLSDLDPMGVSPPLLNASEMIRRTSPSAWSSGRRQSASYFPPYCSRLHSNCRLRSRSRYTGW